jgi:hypothetical protein
VAAGVEETIPVDASSVYVESLDGSTVAAIAQVHFNG